MPSTSKSQQRLFGMVTKYKEAQKKGKGAEYLIELNKKYNKELVDKIKEIAGGVSDKAAKDFAETKHEKLPERVEENKFQSFNEFIEAKNENKDNIEKIDNNGYLSFSKFNK